MIVENQADIFKAAGKGVLLIHLIAIFGLAAIVVFLFIMAAQAELGLSFLLFLFGALIFSVPIPLFLIRLNAFNQSSYIINRDGIRLQWGKRIEEIAIADILWIRKAEDLTVPLKLPWPHWSGAIVGITEHVDGGRIEFMASDKEALLLIGTENQVFAISPEKRENFIRIYHQKIEMGSVSPIEPISEYPSYLFNIFWSSTSAKLFLVVSILLGMGMFLWVGFAVSTRSEVFMGFSSQGFPLGPIPSTQLFLIPALNLILQGTAFLLSTYYHRINPNHTFTYILWISSTVMSVLFYIAIYLSLRVV